MSGRAWSPVANGLRLDVRLTPRGGRDGLEGLKTLSDGRVALAARVCAAPEDGKANEALLQLVGQVIGVARSQCALVAGAKSRVKSIIIHGDPAALESRLDRLCAAAKD